MLKVLVVLQAMLGVCCGGYGGKVLAILDLGVLVLYKCFLFVIEDIVL